MAEQNAATGRITAERAQRYVLAEALTGRLLGCLFAVLAIAAAVYLSMNGHQVVAGIIGGSTVVAITVALITGIAAPKGGSDDD